MIGWKNSRHFLSQWEAKPKPRFAIFLCLPRILIGSLHWLKLLLWLWFLRHSIDNRSCSQLVSPLNEISIVLAPVVQKADNSMQRISRYPVDKMYCSWYTFIRCIATGLDRVIRSLNNWGQESSLSTCSLSENTTKEKINTRLFTIPYWLRSLFVGWQRRIIDLLSLYILFSQCRSCDVPKGICLLFFHKLCVLMHENKTKFQRNSSPG